MVSATGAGCTRSFQAFWSAVSKFKQTFGVDLYSHLQTHVFYARTRNYESCLHRALDAENLPEGVYHNLIQTVNAHSQLLHRYVTLKKRALKLGVRDMLRVGRHFRELPEKDLHAIYAYLMAQPPVKNRVPEYAPAGTPPTQARVEGSSR